MTNEEFIYTAVDYFNEACNRAIGANMLYWQYKPTKDVVEFIVYWRDKRNHRLDYEVSREDCVYADILDGVKSVKSDILVWEETGEWPAEV